MIIAAPPQVKVMQFNHTIEKGRRYLQTCSRTQGASIVLMALLTYLQPTASYKSEWKLWLVAFFMLFPIAPYEIYFIFPINNEVAAIGRIGEEGDVGREALRKIDERLNALFRKWQLRNGGRFIPPLIVSGILASNLSFGCLT